MRTDSSESKGRTPEQVKSDFRRFVKRWHPDLVSATSERSEELTIMETLSQLSKKKDLAGWPASFKTGMRIAFPDMGTIFLPKTPEDLFDVLDHIDRRGALPSKEFPLVNIVHEKKSGENFDENLDPTLEKFKNYVNSVDSTEQLTGVLDLLDLYSEEQMDSIDFTRLFDDRASFLFTRDAWQCGTVEELKSLHERLDAFKFYKESARAQSAAALATRQNEIESGAKAPQTKPHAAGGLVSADDERKRIRRIMDSGARKHFVQQVKNATTPEDIERIEAEVDQFPFINRGELGVVRSVLNRKKRYLKQE